ncbi:MAG: MgtC/SapB family protein [Bacteroidetes bacterium]|nr:MAG: MgtC/SapB family protein [Bacteroidota bacterium]
MDTAWLNFLPPFLQGLLVSAGIGLILGLEREHQQQAKTLHFAGLRTHPLITILGFVVGFISDHYFPWLLPAISLGFAFMVAVAYYVQANAGSLGLTSELAILLAFALGVLVSVGHPGEALAVAVVATVLLSLKDEFQWFIKQITESELTAFIRFFVLAILLLLLLPDRHFGPEDLMHYRELGWIIILISTISFAGYLMLKFTGSERGIFLTALLGGLFSSTMIAWVFGSRSRELPVLSRSLGSGILLSSSILYIRLPLLTSLFSKAVAVELLLPCGLMLVASLLFIWFYTRREESRRTETTALPLGHPLDIKNALWFGVLYIGVSYFMYYSREWFGESGSYFSGIISGLADMDAITISTAKWAQQTDAVAYSANMIIVAALSNTVFKALVSIIRGHSGMRRQMIQGFGLAIIIGLLWLAVRLF